MGKDSTTKFIGLDVHSKTISVAIVDEGRKGEVRHWDHRKYYRSHRESHKIAYVNRR